MEFTDHQYFVDGVLRDLDNVIVVAAFRQDEDQSASEVWIQNFEKWFRIKFEDDLVASIAFDPVTGQMVAVGKNGRTLVCSVPPGALDTAALRLSIVRRSITNNVRHGPLTRVRWLGETAYACGWRGQMYRLTRNGWDAVDRGLPNSVHGNLIDLAIDGNGIIYAVGLKGACFRLDGDRWARVDIPSSAHFYCAATLTDGDVVIGGANGVLLRGRGDLWHVVEDIGFDQNLWGIHEFQGRIWIAGGDAFLGYLDGGAIVEVHPRGERPTKSNRVSCMDGRLFACGPQHLNLFDGLAWREIVLPAPKGGSTQARPVGTGNE